MVQVVLIFQSEERASLSIVGERDKTEETAQNLHGNKICILISKMRCVLYNYLTQPRCQVQGGACLRIELRNYFTKEFSHELVINFVKN